MIGNADAQPALNLLLWCYGPDSHNAKIAEDLQVNNWGRVSCPHMHTPHQFAQNR